SDPHYLPASATLWSRLSRLSQWWSRLMHPIQDRLNLKWFHARSQGQNASSDAGEMRCGPTRRRLGRERAEIAVTVRPKLDGFAKVIGKIERIGEQSLVHGQQRRSKRGGIAAH